MVLASALSACSFSCVASSPLFSFCSYFSLFIVSLPLCFFLTSHSTFIAFSISLLRPISSLHHFFSTALFNSYRSFWPTLQEINYDSPRGGVSVITEKGEVTTSYLLIQKAKVSDSGKYTCIPAHANPDTVNVHVLNGKPILRKTFSFPAFTL